MAKKNRVIVPIGDAHFPYCHKPSGSRILEFIEQKRPDVVVTLGDTYDMLSFSKFTPRLSLLASEELQMGRLAAEEFYSSVRKRLKKSAKIIALKGNHDIRPMLRLAEKMPSLLEIVKGTIDSFFHFDGVETIDDTQETFMIDDWEFTHGHRLKLGDHLKEIQFQHNICCGHTHRGGVHFERVGAGGPGRNKPGRIVAELNAGFWADPFSDALLYRPKRKYFTWTHGVGLIDGGNPSFIPFW